MIDEYTRDCLAVRVARRLGRHEVIEASANVILLRGVPEHIRSDNGPEFVAKDLREWLAKVGTGTLYIGSGSPWENVHYHEERNHQGVRNRLLCPRFCDAPMNPQGPVQCRERLGGLLKYYEKQTA